MTGQVKKFQSHGMLEGNEHPVPVAGSSQGLSRYWLTGEAGAQPRQPHGVDTDWGLWHISARRMHAVTYI